MFILKYLLLNESIYKINYNNIYNIKEYEYNDTKLTYDFVHQLSIITYDSYFEKNSSKWMNTDYNTTLDITEDHDSVNAFIFSNSDNNKHIISFKGTSIYWKNDMNMCNINEMSSVYNDKFNDNLYFSCCYYLQSNLFKKEDCECLTNNEKCLDIPNDGNKYCYKKCYKNSTSYENNYLNVGKKMMEKIQTIIDFNKTDVIFTGHSLGGVIATMMGILYDKYVITFESPGEKHYIDLIGLDYSKTENKIYHFGHNADTIFTGKCNGVFSLCYIGGYIMNTKCHIGNVCEYDVINRLNIKESIYTHVIKYVIENIIEKWNNTLPACKKQDCIDCEDWKYI
jgi:lipase ATG15